MKFILSIETQITEPYVLFNVLHDLLTANEDYKNSRITLKEYCDRDQIQLSINADELTDELWLHNIVLGDPITPSGMRINIFSTFNQGYEKFREQHISKLFNLMGNSGGGISFKNSEFITLPPTSSENDE